MTSITQKQGALWLLLAVCVSAPAWLYVHRILEPWADAKDLQHGGLKAQMGDLYPRWVGARELLLNRRNPYSIEVSHEIQMAYYGHIVTPEEARQRVVDEQRFAYPIYVVFLMAPTMYMSFATVQFWAPFVLGAFAGLIVVFCVGLLDWKLPWASRIALILFAVSSPQIVQGMRHQQLALVVGFLLAAAAWCVHKGHLGTAGILLAMATIKPQMTLLPLIWFLLWAIGNRRARWRLLLSFGLALAGLVGAGEFLLPGWLGDFIAGMAAYRRYFPTTSVLRIILGDGLGLASSLLIVIGLLVFAWRNRQTGGGSRQFAQVFAVFLMVTVISFPLFTPFNQVLLILPALLVLQEWAYIPKASRLAFMALVFWPCITSIGLLLLKTPLTPENPLPLIPAYAASVLPLLLPLVLFTGRVKTEKLFDVERNEAAG